MVLFMYKSIFHDKHGSSAANLTKY